MPDAEALTTSAEHRASDLGAVDLAIGVTSADQIEAVAAALDPALSALERDRSVRAALVLADGRREPAPAAPGRPRVVLASPDQPRTTRAPITGNLDPSLAARSVLETARRIGAKACIMVDPGGVPASEAIGRMADAVLQRELDFVAPYYRRQRFGGAVTRGIVYPLTRALYGKRIRYPFGSDFACSSRMLARFLGGAWGEETTRTGVELSLYTEALCSAMKLGQVVTGTRVQIGSDLGDDLTNVLQSVLSPLFNEVERRVPVWQKIRGSEPVELIGVPTPIEPDSAAFDPEPMLNSFRLGQQNLQEIWALVLPPTTLLELKRLARRPASETAGFADALWARIVYDFALGYHTRVMSRDHLLAAFTPLYLGWFGSFVREMTGADPSRIEQRVETLCLQYEAEKPYLISRWRWPDRFTP
jgi:hypothetical protein